MFLEKLLKKLKLQHLISAATFKNISTLMTGTVIAAVIPILTAPVMSRIFTAANYGVLGLYMSISGLIGVLAFSHYTQAVMLPKEDEEARQVAWFAFTISSGISLVTLLVFSAMYFFSDLISSSEIQFWYFLIPVSIFLNGINAVLITWANRTKSYRQLSFNRIIQAVLTASVQITLGLLLKNETGLLLGLLTGQLVSSGLLVWRFYRQGETGIGRPDKGRFRKIAVRYKDLLVYSTPSDFINNLINQTPIFLLQKFGGVSYVGYYNFTQRFLGLPQMFLSSAIVDVFKQKASYNFNHSGNCKDIYVKTLKVLTALAFIPFLLLTLFAPPIFELVFGNEWRNAGIFAQFLGILFFLRFIVSPLSYVYILAGKMREDFVLHLMFLALTTLSFFVGDALFDDKKYLVLCYSIAYSLVYLVYLARSYKFSKGNPTVL